MSLPVNSRQTPDQSILDLNGRQVYLGNCFISGTQLGSIGSTSETPYFLISNPASSGKSIFIYVKKMSVATTTSAFATFRFYQNPTVTAHGTAVGINNLRMNSNAISSVVNCYQAPTTSSSGTFLADIAIASASSTQVSSVVQVIDPGNAMMISVTESSGTVPVAFEICWYELSFGSVL